LLVGCGTDFGNPVGTGATAMQLIGPSGGTLRLEGVTLSVPPGALRAPTSLTVTSSTRAAPTTYESFSPVYVFGPEGTEFAQPVRVEITSQQPGGSRLVLYWTRKGSASEFSELPSTQVGGTVTANVTHFSSGFIGESRSLFGGSGGGVAIGPGGGAGGGASGGGSTGGDAGEDRDGGLDAGVDGGFDGGVDGEPDAGFDGGLDGGRDGGAEGGLDGGRDGGFDGGADGGLDGGRDGGADGGLDGGRDGGFDGGADGGFDAGADGGFDGGADAGGTDGGFGSACVASSQCSPGLFCLNGLCQ
jgi:hypothetical protein